MPKTKAMNSKAAARIQAANSAKSGGQTTKGSFAARAQSAAAKNATRTSSKK
ncbi:hypothetical protein [Ruegeria sp. HKCCA5929]|uniref:hypothetical protein n=1 Tax=Ruegeria sp. HKCCA5929 TaxID=2682988 RepID=UPI0014895103